MSIENEIANDATQGDLARRMAELGQRYLERTAGEVDALGGLVNAISGGDRDTYKSIEAMAHRIRGSGAMFGFETISDVAGEIELLAIDAKSGLHPDRHAMHARFSALLRVLAFVVKAAKQ